MTYTGSRFKKNRQLSSPTCCVCSEGTEHLARLAKGKDSESRGHGTLKNSQRVDSQKGGVYST